MALMEVQELSGPALDWAVAKCEGYIEDYYSWLHEATVKDVADSDSYHPSVKWGQGGPIIERGLINTSPHFTAGRTEGGSDVYQQDGWKAYITPPAFWVTPRPFTGPTPLIAAMRCYVASKVGTHIEVPE